MKWFENFVMVLAGMTVAGTMILIVQHTHMFNQWVH